MKMTFTQLDQTSDIADLTSCYKQAMAMSVNLISVSQFDRHEWQAELSFDRAPYRAILITGDYAEVIAAITYLCMMGVSEVSEFFHPVHSLLKQAGIYLPDFAD